MRELGESSKQLHEEVGRAAAGCGADWLIGVGAGTADLLAAAKGAGFPEERMRHFSDSMAAAEALRGMVQEGDLVLLKGSRGVHLEKIAEALSGLAKNAVPKPELAAS
jgi:UDP-N-acetylmuramoyl-tripeptide--D-alanyl-D-alanine ligase